MSLKLFIHSIDIQNISCDFDNCEICSKNKFYLLMKKVKEVEIVYVKNVYIEKNVF